MRFVLWLFVCVDIWILWVHGPKVYDLIYRMQVLSRAMIFLRCSCVEWFVLMYSIIKLYVVLWIDLFNKWRIFCCAFNKRVIHSNYFFVRAWKFVFWFSLEMIYSTAPLDWKEFLVFLVPVVLELIMHSELLLKGMEALETSLLLVKAAWVLNLNLNF